ncbi:putative polyunsaturated fatty acid synthase PfaB and C [Actinacidiphila reveromycinica]|uniref:Putative polyunsaturated fatty acid synthase PfaB and C n=1 Tax=Actinacidiphila reveromycinica TaxID=659352 RepID=A0A7U3VQV9_9ACTN|nr:beta-ketoacyl synthase N-terminal-like domain-containing protein [Streptomyces sp. SN-593]BBB00135.1 putative polyunsaturated fatty acid synthase PfaB and C [Streptomyces sp. SN-593]
MSKYAIVGLSCLLPGAETPEQFWQNLRSGTDSRTDGGEEVFGPAPAAGDADPQHGIYCRRGGFVSDFRFDPTGYLLDPGHLSRLDRLFHWSLHVAREALRDTGHADRPATLARTGLILGNYSFPTPASTRVSVPLAQEAVLEGLRRSGLPELAGLGQGALTDPGGPAAEDLRVSGSPAGLAATALGLGGPRYALDAACSSALYALKLACDHLAAGQADLVLAGGVCAPEPTLIHLSFSDLRAYPRDGFSQPFDDRSGGILTGQGAGMVAVRRLADALRDGDRIYAVVDGIGLSNDGSGRHLLVPQGDGQLDSYELAYAGSGVDPAAIDYLECHATGTPIGDATEADSVAAFFGRHGKVPLIGSVKGNIGHLLTVAGLSSMLKVVLAMANGHIPPTIGVEQPVTSKDGAVGDGVLVRSGRPWPRGDGPRRAAVSAFGFGGTNAHVLLSEPGTADEPGAADDQDATVLPALDVVGLGAHFGAFDGVDAFERAVHAGADGLVPLPERRWRGLEQVTGGSLEQAAGVGPRDLPHGAFVDGVGIDPMDHKIPPADLRTYNLQHALATKVADEALHDAGFSRAVPKGRSAPDPRRIAVVVAMEIEPYTHARLTRYGLGGFLREQFAQAGLELTDEQRAALTAVGRDAVVDPIVANEVLSYIGNVMASRISSLWNLTGPSFTVSSDGSGTVEALEIARLLLLDPGIEAVLVGAVDLAGSAENLLLRPDVVEAAGLTFGEGARGRRIGEGAGAVVVTRSGESAGTVYARLDSIAVRHAAPAGGVLPEADAEPLAAAAAAALAGAGITAADVGYVEAHAGGTAVQDRAELAALARVYPSGGGSVALGSAKAQIGDAGCAAAMAGLIRTALCLHHGYLPGTSGWVRPAEDLDADFAASALYVPAESRPWLRTAKGARRYAAIDLIGAGGTHGHLVLSADTTRGAVAATDWQRAGGPLLLPLGADSAGELVASVERHRDLLAGGADPYELARTAAAALDGRRLRVVLVGRDGAELQAQARLAAGDLPGALARGDEWATPAGSFCTPRPIGPDGKVALVYPGAFNSYPGLGQDFFRAFPGLLDRFEAQADEPSRLFRAEQLYPRTQVAPQRRDLMQLETRLGDDIPFMLATGTSFAILYTELVRDVLGVTAHGGFGYSLGESSMLFATGGWLPAGRRDDLISGTPIFRDRLCGPRRTVREQWGLPDSTPDKDVWSTHVLLSAEEPVREALARHDRVHLTHVNTPGELVIAGDPAQCAALIRELGCPAARSPVNVVMHNPVVDVELDGLAGLNDYPTGSIGDLELFSAYDYQAIRDLDRERVSRRIAHTLRSTIDFPRLVRTAYDRGFRYFLEVGPSATCSRWVRDTLGDAPHVAASIDRRGVPATKSVAQMVARLVGHGLPVDLTALLGPEAGPDRGAGRRAGARRFRVGGGDPMPTRIARGVAAALAAATPTAPSPAGAPAVPGVPAPAVAGAGSAAVPAPRPSGARAAAGTPAPHGEPAVAADPGAAEQTAAPAAGPLPAQLPPTVPVLSAPPEEPALMPADPTLADPEVIAFDGDPITFLPWAPAAPAEPAPYAAAAAAAAGGGRPGALAPAPAAPAPASAAAAGPAAVPAVREAAAPGAAPARTAAAGPAPTPAAGLIRELRAQMLATHTVVMETQRVLQSATLDRAEALLDPASSAAPAAPVRPAPPRQAAPQAVPPAPVRRSLPAAASAPVPALPPAGSAPAPAGTAPAAPVPPPAPAPAGAPVSAPAAGSPARTGVIWDEADLLEFATGSVAKVFGPEFEVIDSYAKRVRLPAQPYHFVTRVTALKGTTGVFQPATITTEYDVPEDAWYAVDGGVPPAVTVEAGQCDLLLVSYLGIDFRNKGERVYRLLDSSLIFRGGLPRTGQTLRYDISIDRFVHQGDTTIFFFSYFCYADGELILELKDACAGFFSQQELDTPLGVVITEKERAARAALPRGYFKPLAYTDKNHLTTADLELLAQGRPGDVFGPHHAQAPGINPALRLPDERLRMVDDVTVDRTGGPRGLGKLVATKQLQPDAWYFACHFPDDPVLAGSLVAEGAVQLLQIYLLHQGMHLTLPDARFQTMTDLRIDVQVRGQITPAHSEIRYEVEVMELTLLPRASVVADILVYLGDKPVIRMRNLGLQVREKEGTPYRPEVGGFPAFLGRTNRSGEPAMINEMHLAHAAKGDLGVAMGPEFDIYRTSRAPYIPNGDFQFVDRVMSLEGTRGDLSPGSVMVCEYDSPADAWYYRQNSSPYMPNCVYMESSLQAAIFLGYYLGATLGKPQEQYAIRNLDGRATLVKDIDLRGRTIRHTSKLLMTSAVSGAVLQNFSYELSADGEVFYTGESLFGYFSAAALANQAGLDNGRFVPPWIEQEQVPAERVREIALPAGAPAFSDPTGGELHLPADNFALVDRVELVADGGRHGAGYVHGYRQVRPDEWYFDCHFHRDPVMPGSLGVEAVLQALRLFVMETGLADGIEQPRFAMAEGVEMSWKYRGQILRNDGEMQFDTHVKEVRREADRLLVIADADLWKPGLRIYELVDVAIEVRPGGGA